MLRLSSLLEPCVCDVVPVCSGLSESPKVCFFPAAHNVDLNKGQGISVLYTLGRTGGWLEMEQTGPKTKMTFMYAHL